MAKTQDGTATITISCSGGEIKVGVVFDPPVMSFEDCQDEMPACHSMASMLLDHLAEKFASARTYPVGPIKQ